MCTLSNIVSVSQQLRGLFSTLPFPQTSPSNKAALMPAGQPKAGSVPLLLPPPLLLQAFDSCNSSQPAHAGGGFCTDSIFCSNRHSQLLPGSGTWISSLFWLKLCDLSQALIWPIGLSLQSWEEVTSNVWASTGLQSSTQREAAAVPADERGSGMSMETQYWSKCVNRRFLPSTCRLSMGSSELALEKEIWFQMKKLK